MGRAACAVGLILSLAWLHLPAAQGVEQAIGASFEDFFEAVTGDEIGEDAAKEEVDPEKAPVPVNGDWTEWGNWGVCEGVCGTDVRWKRTRRRECINPAPDFGGDYCSGSAFGHSYNCTTTVCPTILVPLTFSAHCDEFDGQVQRDFAQGIATVVGLSPSRVVIHTRCVHPHPDDTSKRRRLSAAIASSEALSKAIVSTNDYSLLVELRPDADETLSLGWIDGESPTRVADLEAGITASLQQSRRFQVAMVDAAGHTDAPDYWSGIFLDTQSSFVPTHMIDATQFNISAIAAVTDGLEELPESDDSVKLKSIAFLSLCLGLTLFVLAVLGAVTYGEVTKMRQRGDYGMVA